MRILFLSDNFPPETNAPATRTFEHAREWVAAGHAVTVITCAPNFPAGRLHEGYRNALRARERVEGIDVVRVWSYLAPNQGFARRLLDQASFGVTGMLAALFEERPDVLVATSPQPFAAVGGLAAARFCRVPFVLELRDLWPASLAAVGVLRPGRTLRALERAELRLYRSSEAIVAVSEAFRSDLARRGIDPARVHVVTNGVDLERCSPRPRDVELARELGLEGCFVVGYLGTHGLAHRLENVLDAAALLAGEERVRFLFAGDGAARGALVAEAARRGLKNVVFLPPQARAAMPRLWSVCDVALVHLGDAELFGTVLPSKLFEALGMGIPLLVAAPEGEASALVRASDCGLCVPPQDPRALALAVRRLARDEAMRGRLARRAHEAGGRFDRRSLAHRMLAILESAARRDPAQQRAAGPDQRAPRTAA